MLTSTGGTQTGASGHASDADELVSLQLEFTKHLNEFVSLLRGHYDALMRTTQATSGGAAAAARGGEEGEEGGDDAAGDELSSEGLLEALNNLADRLSGSRPAPGSAAAIDVEMRRLATMP